MVSRRPAPRRGAGELGCVLSLLLFVGALYYGVNIGQVYLRYYELLDGMRTQARLAPSLSDDAIQRRLVGQADILLPRGAPRFRVTRGGRPNRIVIETEYTDPVDLPFFKYEFILRPRAEEPL